MFAIRGLLIAPAFAVILIFMKSHRAKHVEAGEPKHWSVLLVQAVIAIVGGGLIYVYFGEPLGALVGDGLRSLLGR